MPEIYECFRFWLDLLYHIPVQGLLLIFLTLCSLQRYNFFQVACQVAVSLWRCCLWTHVIHLKNKNSCFLLCSLLYVELRKSASDGVLVNFRLIFLILTLMHVKYVACSTWVKHLLWNKCCNGGTLFNLITSKNNSRPAAHVARALTQNLVASRGFFFKLPWELVPPFRCSIRSWKDWTIPPCWGCEN